MGQANRTTRVELVVPAVCGYFSTLISSRKEDEHCGRKTALADFDRGPPLPTVIVHKSHFEELAVDACSRRFVNTTALIVGDPPQLPRSPGEKFGRPLSRKGYTARRRFADVS